jgi:alanine-alpha-ketoisovalerate/valine-pyruvate aminotransferase
LDGRYLSNQGLYVVQLAGVRTRREAEALRGGLAKEGAIFSWLWLPELPMTDGELSRTENSQRDFPGSSFFPGWGED